MPKPLTIEDIRNPKLKSGFKNVHYIQDRRRKTDSVPFQAMWGAKKGPGTNHSGPRRTTAEEAAQDYCDYLNGQSIQPPATLATIDKSARPAVKKRTITAREVNLRKQLRKEVESNPAPRVHPPICYLVGIKDDRTAVKIGYADYNVFSRLDSLQTGNPRELKLLATLLGGMKKEKELHAKYAKYNILQEWFTPSKELLAEFGLTWDTYTRKVFA